MAAYVRKKRVGQHEYFQLVENRRVEGKPRQRVLLHLGKHQTVEDALKKWPREIQKLRKRAREYRDKVPEGSEDTSVYRNALKRAIASEKHADSLEDNLEKLRELKKQGVV